MLPANVVADRYLRIAAPTPSDSKTRGDGRQPASSCHEVELGARHNKVVMDAAHAMRVTSQATQTNVSSQYASSPSALWVSEKMLRESYELQATALQDDYEGRRRRQEERAAETAARHAHEVGTLRQQVQEREQRLQESQVALHAERTAHENTKLRLHDDVRRVREKGQIAETRIVELEHMVAHLRRTVATQEQTLQQAASHDAERVIRATEAKYLAARASSSAPVQPAPASSSSAAVEQLLDLQRRKNELQLSLSMLHASSSAAGLDAAIDGANAAPADGVPPLLASSSGGLRQGVPSATSFSRHRSSLKQSPSSAGAASRRRTVVARLLRGDNPSDAAILLPAASRRITSFAAAAQTVRVVQRIRGPPAANAPRRRSSVTSAAGIREADDDSPLSPVSSAAKLISRRQSTSSSVLRSATAHLMRRASVSSSSGTSHRDGGGRRLSMGSRRASNWSAASDDIALDSRHSSASRDDENGRRGGSTSPTTAAGGNKADSAPPLSLQTALESMAPETLIAMMAKSQLEAQHRLAEASAKVTKTAEEFEAKAGVAALRNVEAQVAAAVNEATRLYEDQFASLKAASTQREAAMTAKWKEALHYAEEQLAGKSAALGAMHDQLQQAEGRGTAADERTVAAKAACDQLVLEVQRLHRILLAADDDEADASRGDAPFDNGAGRRLCPMCHAGLLRDEVDLQYRYQRGNHTRPSSSVYTKRAAADVAGPPPTQTDHGRAPSLAIPRVGWGIDSHTGRVALRLERPQATAQPPPAAVYLPPTSGNSTSQPAAMPERTPADFEARQEALRRLNTSSDSAFVTVVAAGCSVPSSFSPLAPLNMTVTPARLTPRRPPSAPSDGRASAPLPPPTPQIAQSPVSQATL